MLSSHTANLQHHLQLGHAVCIAQVCHVHGCVTQTDSLIPSASRNVRRSLWHRGSPELLMLGERHGIDLSLVEGLEQFRLDLHTSWWSRMRWSGYMLPEDAADASYEWIKTIWTVLSELPSSNSSACISAWHLASPATLLFDAQYVSNTTLI